MRRSIWSMLTVLAVLALAGLARAEDPKPDPSKAAGIEERQQQRKEALQAAMTSQEIDKALSILEEIASDKELADDERFMAGFAQFELLAKEKKDGAKACLLAKKLSETKRDNKDHAMLLNELAWTILDTADLKNRDLDLALVIAKQAAELSKHEDGAILDTLARAYFEKNDLDKAIEIQIKAVEKTDANDMMPDEVKAQVKDTLERYKTKKGEKKS